MSRISTDLRDRLPNRVCSHFDKYCEIINPVEFDPVKDIYRPLIPDKAWDSLQHLISTDFRRNFLSLSNSFDLYLGDRDKSNYRRNYVTFYLPDGGELPDMDFEFDDLPETSQQSVGKWVNKAIALKKLRHKLWRRLEKVLDHGWDSRKYWDGYRGNFRGGPTPGQGCNTAGQLVRLWPELLPFLPSEFRSTLVQAQVKSRLPKYIADHGKPNQFRLIERPYHHNAYDSDREPYLTQSEPYTDEEWANEKRMVEGINHILVQMSLMQDTPRKRGYPSIQLRD